MGIIEAIFGALSSVALGVVNVFTDVFSGVGGLFYIAPDATNNIDGGLTLLGILSLVAVGIALFMWVFRMIQGLIKSRVK